MKTRSVIPGVISCQSARMMTTRIHDNLSSMNGLTQPRTTFLAHLFVLFMSLPGRHTFLNMGRYGTYSEKTYRTHFEDDFDFFAFNRLLIDQTCSAHRILAADCRFVPKSGKQTPHLGVFWNGSVSKAMTGLEISEIALVDVEKNTAFPLECLQTPGHLPDDETRVDWYAKQIVDRAPQLKELADYLVYDGAAAKKKCVDAIVDQTQLHLISKLRKDADLRYLYTGPRRPGPGRPKCYDGKMDCQHPDLTRFEECYTDTHLTMYTAIVNSPSLKRNIRIAYVQDNTSDQYVILFSTDVTLDGPLIYRYDKARFHIEFLFRDGKQYTGLTQSQARSEQKLFFHVHTSLTSVSLAKAEFYADPENVEKPFSMHDVNIGQYNQLFLDHIFTRLELDPTSEQLAPVYHEFLNFGKIAA